MRVMLFNTVELTEISTNISENLGRLTLKNPVLTGSVKKFRGSVLLPRDEMNGLAKSC